MKCPHCHFPMATSSIRLGYFFCAQSDCDIIYYKPEDLASRNQYVSIQFIQDQIDGLPEPWDDRYNKGYKDALIDLLNYAKRHPKSGLAFICPDCEYAAHWEEIE